MTDFPSLRSAEWLQFNAQYEAQYSADQTIRSAAKALNDMRCRALNNSGPRARDARRLEARYAAILDNASQSTERTED